MCNRDNYTLALSPKAIHEATGVCLDTVRKNLHELEQKNYITHIKDNMYSFYEYKRIDKSIFLNKINNYTSFNYNEMY